MSKHSSQEADLVKISRRDFLGIAFGSSLGVLLSQGTGALVKYLRPPIQKEGRFGGVIFAGQANEFGIGSITHIQAGRFYITRTEDGMMALWHRCTHLGCAVPWVEEENQFHCPCHGSLFNKVGEVTGGPAPRPLDYYSIENRSGEIWVDTRKPYQRNKFDPTQLIQT